MPASGSKDARAERNLQRGLRCELVGVRDCGGREMCALGFRVCRFSWSGLLSSVDSVSLVGV